jgi:hypothetical protein
MKRICVSVGLLALGAAAAHAQYAPGLSELETSKPWSLEGTLRGFYDDNYLTLPSSYLAVNPATGTLQTYHSRDSYGIEVSPSIAYNHSVEDTLLSASFVYDLKWYEDRDGTTDQTYQFNAKMDHEFSERYKLTLAESFVVAQEPGVLDPTVISTPLRVEGSNIRNTSTADLMIQMTRLFDLHIGYANSVYAYQQNAGDEAPANSGPSYSALLDRIDQTAAIDLRWKVLPETTGVLGYQYEHVDYTSPEYIIYPSAFGPGFRSNSRNTDSHFAYVGADQSFTPDLNGSIRAGAEYVDYYNSGTSEVSPYVDASLTYQYMRDSTAQVGVKHLHNSTDVAGVTGSTSPVLDEESTAVYASVSHRVTSRFTVAALGQAQYSTFDGGGGAYNGKEENFYVLNLDLAYHFTPWLTGETGYSYNKLNTQIADRGYTRDIVYVGIRAIY